MTSPRLAHSPVTTPSAVLAARWLAGFQVAGASCASAFFLVFALNGGFTQWGGLFLLLAMPFIVAALLIGVPLIRLRRGRRHARIGLIVGEAVLTVPLLPLASGAVAITSAAPYIFIVAYVGSIAGVIYSLTQPDARTWSNADPITTQQR